MKPDQLIKRLQALEEMSTELASIVSIWPAETIPEDTDWKGQGWIANAREWLALLKACRDLKHNPEIKTVAESDARKCFHALHELVEKAQRESPDEYARFIAEAQAIADEARELIDGPT